jgi:serralysin
MEEIKPCIDKIGRINPYERSTDGTIAGVTELMWPKGTTFKIKFIEGESNVISKVKEKFNLWLQYASTLKFEYVDDDSANVIVGFDQNDGHWSNLGKEILNNPEKKKTMNLGWPHDRQISDEEIERVAVHEMGHTLGFIHEQSSPKAEIDWDEEKVYEYYQRTQGWSRDDIFTNILFRYSEQITQYTDFDPTSIMEYPIPGFLRKQGGNIVGGTNLSEMDKSFAKKWYGNP